MGGRSGLEPGLSKLVAQFTAGVFDLLIASVSILQISAFPLSTVAAQGTPHCPSPALALSALALLGVVKCMLLSGSDHITWASTAL